VLSESLAKRLQIQCGMEYTNDDANTLFVFLPN